MTKQSNLQRLIDKYIREHDIRAGWVQTYRNRHHTICDRYGTKDYTQCDCLSVPKLTLGGMGRPEVHEVFDPESSEIGYIIAPAGSAGTCEPAEVQAALEGVPKKPPSKLGRNELCPCESGKKYKKC
jgi:SEC-C motif